MSHNFVRFQVFHLLYLLSLMIKSISRLSSSFIKSLMLTKPLLKRSCNPVSLIFISAATSFKYLLSLRTSLLTHALNATGSANFSAAFHSFSVGFSNFTLSPAYFLFLNSNPFFVVDFFSPFYRLISNHVSALFSYFLCHFNFFIILPLYFCFSLPLAYIVAPLYPVVKSFFEKSQNKKSRANALLTGINGVVFL